MIMPPDFVPKIQFWTKQQGEMFGLSWNQREYALFCEPRTGKSKPVVDTAWYHFIHKQNNPLHIDGMIIVAWPNGVHSGWIKDAFPENMPPHVPWKGFVWNSNMTSRQWYKQDFVDLCKFDGLAVFAINAEALPFEKTKLAIGYFLKYRRRVALIADESSFMSGANNRRTRVMYNLSLRPEIVWKRILDGTPAADQGPLDLFPQLRFLNPAILGMTTNAEFKARYCEYEIASKRNGVLYPVLRGFRNIEELQEKLAPVSYRTTFAECFRDVPHKIYQLRRFGLSIAQQRVYDDLRDEFRAELEGKELTAPLALTRMMRLQQIASNYFPSSATGILHAECGGEGCDQCDGGVIIERKPPTIIDKGETPRIEALKQELKGGQPTIVWARFRQSAVDCFNAALALGLKPVMYNGSVDAAGKEHAKTAFQSGEANVFVGNVRSAGRGIPLWRAAQHVFYENTFSYRDRQQAEDRAEIAHRRIPTQVIDLVADNTIDDLAIIPAFRRKHEVAQWLMNDPIRAWL